MNHRQLRSFTLGMAISGVASSVMPAQSAPRGTELPASSEVRAIVSAIRSIARTERVELNLDSMCSVDLPHPACPANLQKDEYRGRLPGKVWLAARDELKRDAQVGSQHGSLLKATYVSVQRPVSVADSIFVLAELLRRDEDGKRVSTIFDIMLRGDSLHMETVRATPRGDPRAR